ncbi:hypothetical protein KSS87_014059, partial [Heliosperma pusillum]
MKTMGNEGRLICSHEELQCKQRLMKENSLFRQGVTIQKMDNRGRCTDHTS